jgi:hypothetical protein
MSDEDLFDALRQAAEKLGAEVRVEAFETPAAAGGGLCTLRGEPWIVLDQRAPLSDRIVALARALAALESEAVYMLPEARAVVDAVKGGRSGERQRAGEG